MILLALAALLFAACKPSVEGESKAWTGNVAKVEGLAATYPGFKDALQARIKSATAVYDKAEGLADEAKAEQLRAANQALMSGFVDELAGVEAKLDVLRKKRVEAAAKAGDDASLLAAKVAAEDASKTIERVEKALTAGASDDAGAGAVLTKVKKDIKTATDAVESVLKVDKEKQETKAADAQAADAKAADAKAAEDAKVADWKCEFCDGMNKHDATKCESCGAPRANK